MKKKIKPKIGDLVSYIGREVPLNVQQMPSFGVITEVFYDEKYGYSFRAEWATGADECCYEIDEKEFEIVLRVDDL